MINTIKIILGTLILATGIARAEVCIHLTGNTIGSPGDQTVYRITAIDKKPTKRNTIVSQPIPYGDNISYYFKAPDVSSLNTIKIETLTTTGNHKSAIKLHCENPNIEVPTASADISVNQDTMDPGQCMINTLPYQQPMTPCSN